MEVGAVVDDAQVLATEPLEVLRMGEDDLREAIGMRDNVHSNGEPHHVEEVYHRPQLPFGARQMREGIGKLIARELAVDVEAADTVEASHDARLPHGQQVYRILGRRQGHRVLHDRQEGADRAHVDTYHVGAAKPTAVASPRRRTPELGGEAVRRLCGVAVLLGNGGVHCVPESGPQRR